MFRSSTILRELVHSLAKVIFMLKHSVKLQSAYVGEWTIYRFHNTRCNNKKCLATFDNKWDLMLLKQIGDWDWDKVLQCTKIIFNVYPCNKIQNDRSRSNWQLTHTCHAKFHFVLCDIQLIDDVTDSVSWSSRGHAGLVASAKQQFEHGSC